MKIFGVQILIENQELNLQENKCTFIETKKKIKNKIKKQTKNFIKKITLLETNATRNKISF